ncbi:MAG: hypothetical protein Q4A40_04840 [Bacillota bacterium]|nr:hypothetical protein [Bacillota bacterium]
MGGLIKALSHIGNGSGSTAVMIVIFIIIAVLLVYRFGKKK